MDGDPWFLAGKCFFLFGGNHSIKSLGSSLIHDWELEVVDKFHNGDNYAGMVIVKRPELWFKILLLSFLKGFMGWFFLGVPFKVPAKLVFFV